MSMVPKCASKATVTMERCNTCCCKRGLTGMSVSHTLLSQGKEGQCGPFLVATDFILRSVLSAVRSFGLVIQSYSGRCFMDRGLHNANQAAGKNAAIRYYVVEAHKKSKVNQLSSEAPLTPKWKLEWKVGASVGNMINLAAKTFNKAPGIDIVAMRRTKDTAEFYGPFEPGVCRLDGKLQKLKSKKCGTTRKVYYFRAMPKRVQNGDQLLSQGKPTMQSSSHGNMIAARAVDGNTVGNVKMGSCTHTALEKKSAWWRVDLERERTIKYVKIWNRVDCCAERLRAAQVKVGNTANATTGGPGSNAAVCGTVKRVGAVQVMDCKKPLRGRYLFVTSNSGKPLTLCEVAVYGN